MMNKIISVLVLFVILNGAVVAQPVYENPVGCITIPLPGTGGTQTQKNQIASQGLLPWDAVQYSGTITSATATYIEDSSGTWTAGDYTGAVYPNCVIEITSGSLAGSMTWIMASDDSAGAGQRLITGDDLSTANGSTFRVLKTFTISSLLGAVPKDSVMKPAGNQTDADNFLLHDPTTNAYSTFYYENSGVGQEGWKSTIGVGDFADYGIFPTDGMLFVRKQSEDGKLVIAGRFKETATNILIYGDGANDVLNVISNPHPVDQLTIGNSGLYTGDSATGLQGGSSAASADTVLILNAATGNYTTYYYKNGGAIGGTGWRSTATLNEDASNDLLPSGSGILIQRKSGNSFTWNVPALNF